MGGVIIFIGPVAIEINLFFHPIRNLIDALVIVHALSSFIKSDGFTVMAGIMDITTAHDHGH
jgi:hypothetical protein